MRPDGQRHVGLWVRQVSAAVLQVSSRHLSENEWQEEEQQRQRIILCVICGASVERVAMYKIVRSNPINQEHS